MNKKVHQTVVTVTQDDIDRGRKTASRCPLARAIRRVTGIRPVAVFGSQGYDCGDGTYDLDGDALVFIYAFDAGQPVIPQSFVIDVPR